ncbi:MAG: type II toxin-antitoxin system HicA family toxin [Bryobacterales bacterium]|nr:type II toxin-antitoxin system HicA family toxin [Bryobacterales bacterium]
MSNWPASKARRVLAALERIGWQVKRQRGSHRLLTCPDWLDYVTNLRHAQHFGGVVPPAGRRG